MSTKFNKSTKTPTRVKINTIVLFALSITFGAITFVTASQIYQASRNFQSVSDAPGLCYDESESLGGIVRENSYICTTEYDEVTDQSKAATTTNEQALFLYDRLTLSSLIRSGDMIVTVIAIGSMFTLGALATTFVYWNHNKARN